MTNAPRYYTSSDWVNRKPVALDQWPLTDPKRRGKPSRLSSAGAMKAKALLKRLPTLGVK